VQRTLGSGKNVSLRWLINDFWKKKVGQISKNDPDAEIQQENEWKIVLQKFQRGGGTFIPRATSMTKNDHNAYIDIKMNKNSGALRLLKALRLFFLSNFPGPTFIPCPTTFLES
jgi:hypothetical protein